MREKIFVFILHFIQLGSWLSLFLFREETSDEQAFRYRAHWALTCGRANRAIELAERALEILEPHEDNWNHDNIVHHSNAVIGLAYVKKGLFADASEYLLLASEIGGSPQLDSFGPSMKLAQELLSEGYESTVILYLRRCLEFWNHEAATESITQWIDDIQNGDEPHFGKQLYLGMI